MTKNGVLKAKVDGVVVELMVKTIGANVYLDDETTLSSKIAEMVLAINDKAKKTDLENLKQEILGDTPVEAYNTFTELAAYIEEHKEVSDALTAAIGNKADARTVAAIQTELASLGSLATKSKVSESDLDSDLTTKINAAAHGNHSHSNKTVLDGITADKVSEWDGKSKIYVSSTKPENLSTGDLWFDVS